MNQLEEGNGNGEEPGTMKDRKITDTEKIAQDKIQSNFDHVLRTTPRAIEKFEEEHPDICELVNQKVQEEGMENLGTVFRPGIPDFLGFNEDGSYRFIEVKGGGDGLRHSQLKWFRDFKHLNSEIWFTDSNEGLTEKMNSDKLDLYSLKTGSVDRGEAEVRNSGEEDFLAVQIPKTLAAMMELEAGDKVNWNVSDRSTLELDTD
ncbi:MAG: hypothetical protein BRC27_01205 [Nanohaloarchaea archaeon SW_10_44_10]|nr:MAG: hypothetical protein BRC27_01205 [Nanohaloarchaea archaeon SW_10_44_10]